MIYIILCSQSKINSLQCSTLKLNSWTMLKFLITVVSCISLTHDTLVTKYNTNSKIFRCKIIVFRIWCFNTLEQFKKSCDPSEIRLLLHLCLMPHCNYRSDTVNSKSFVGKVLLRIKWKFEL